MNSRRFIASRSLLSKPQGTHFTSLFQASCTTLGIARTPLKVDSQISADGPAGFLELASERGGATSFPNLNVTSADWKLRQLFVSSYTRSRLVGVAGWLLLLYHLQGNLG
jgi:hypothetical protein